MRYDAHSGIAVLHGVGILDVEASVKETVCDSGWGECLVLVERCFPYIPAPVIYRCTRSKGVVNCEVVAS